MVSKKLQSRLEAHCSANGLTVPRHPPPSPSSAAAASTRPSGGDGDAKRKRAYVPKRRSGAHAILLALHRASQADGYRGYMTKAEIVTKAQPLCDSSFTTVKAGSHYAAWASMKTLIDKGMIEKAGSPPRFSLTIEGEVLGQKLHDVEASDGPSPYDIDDDDDDDDDDGVLGGGGGGGGGAKHSRHGSTLDGWVAGPATAGHAAGSARSSMAKPTATSAGAAGGWGTRTGSAASTTTASSRGSSAACAFRGGGGARKGKEDSGSARAATGEDDGWGAGWGADGSSLFSPVDSGRSLRASDFDLPVVPPELARLVQGDDGRAGSPALFSLEASANWRESVHSSPSFALRPGDFDLVLAIDTSEHTGSRKDKGVIQQQLESMGVATDVRRLTLGDFLWVAREKVCVCVCVCVCVLLIPFLLDMIRLALCLTQDATRRRSNSVRITHCNAC
jgi:hypothetical protein